MRIDHEFWLRAFSPTASSPEDDTTGQQRSGKTDLLPGQQLTFQASPSTISSAASRLSRILSDPQGAATARPALAFAPLIDAHPSDTAGMAASVQRSLTFSGLFYESHVLQWSMGERLLADLMKEPQARFSASRGRARGEACRNRASETDGGAGQPPDAGGSDSGGPEAAGIMEEILGPAALFSQPLVREQLAILLSGMVRWQGEVWPGQEMEWNIERDGEDSDETEDPTWRTTIRLLLPGLGAVEATLALTPGGIRGEIAADSPGSVDFMKQGQASLENSMAEAGLRLRELVIRCEPGG